MGTIFFDEPEESQIICSWPSKKQSSLILNTVNEKKMKNNTYSASAAGFHEQGTSFFTFSERVMLVLSNSTLYNVMNHPS